MKQFFSTLFDTVAQRLQANDSKRDDDPFRLARVRRAMIELVGDDSNWEAEQLRHRMLVAESARALWFMRPDLLHWLCRAQDERSAMAQVMALDQFNPQIAARILGAFRSFKGLEPKRRSLARKALQRVAKANKTSRDVYEIVSKMLDA